MSASPYPSRNPKHYHYRYRDLMAPCSHIRALGNLIDSPRHAFHKEGGGPVQRDRTPGRPSTHVAPVQSFGQRRATSAGWDGI